MKYFLLIYEKKDGPHAEHIREMLEDGSIAPITLACSEDDAGNWKPINSFPEVIEPPKPKDILKAAPLPPPPKESAAIRQKAENIAGVGLYIMGLGIVVLLWSGFVAAIGNTEGDSRNALIACIVSASLLTFGIWAYLIAQVVHIRANTHKD